MRAIKHKSRGRRCAPPSFAPARRHTIQVVIMSIQDRAVDKSLEYFDNNKYDYPCNLERSSNNEKMCALRRGDG